MNALLITQRDALNINIIRSITLGMVLSSFALIYVCLVYFVWRGWKTIVQQRIQLESFADRLESQLQVSTAEIALVDEVARIVTFSLDIDQVYGRFTEETGKVVPFDRISINIIDHLDESFQFKYVFGNLETGRNTGDIVPLEGTQVQHVMNTKTTLVRNDIASGPAFDGDQRILDSGISSVIMGPLISRDQVIGAMSVRHQEPDINRLRDQVLLDVGVQRKWDQFKGKKT